MLGYCVVMSVNKLKLWCLYDGYVVTDYEDDDEINAIDENPDNSEQEDDK